MSRTHPPTSRIGAGLWLLCGVAALVGCASVPSGPPMEAEGSTGYPTSHVGSLRAIETRAEPTPEALAALRRFAVSSDPAKPIAIHQERISAIMASRSAPWDVVMTVVHNFYCRDDKGALLPVGSVIRAFEADCGHQRFNDMGILAVTTGENGQGRVYAGSRQADAKRVQATPAVFGQPTNALAPKLYDFACRRFGQRAVGSTRAPAPQFLLQSETRFLACAPRDRDLDRRRSNLTQAFNSHEANSSSLRTRKAWVEATIGISRQNRQPLSQSLRDSINRFNTDNDRHTARARELHREQDQYNRDLRSYRRDCDGLRISDPAGRHICRDINHFGGVCDGIFAQRPGVH